MERFSFIEGREVFSCGLGQGIGYTGIPILMFKLIQGLEAIGTSVSKLYMSFPFSKHAAEQGLRVLVIDQVLHLFVETAH